MPSLGHSVTLAALLLLGDPTFAVGDGSFLIPRRIDGVPHPVSVSAGDFNKDGKLDLAVVNGTGETFIFLQDPVSRDLWQARTAGQAGNGSYYIHAVDLDRDGDDDLVVCDPGTQTFIIKSRGDGTFEAPVALARTVNSRIAAVGDWNEDGILDLAVLNTPTSFSIHIGFPSGSYSFLKSYPATNAHDMAAVDYDGDQHLDLLLKVKETGIFPFHGRGDGTFEAKELVSNLTLRGPIVVADFNGDKKGDILTDYGVGISLGNGTFQKTLAFDHPFSPLAAGELTGDGILDAAIARDDRKGFDLFPGRGDGTFLPQTTFLLGDEVTFFIARDLDADGHMDIAAVSEGGLSVVWGRAGGFPLSAPILKSGFSGLDSLAIADFDVDGAPDFLFTHVASTDVEVFLHLASGSLNAPPRTLKTSKAFSFAAAADLNQDGVPDLAGANVADGEALLAILGSAGQVTLESRLTAGQNPSGVAVRDVDGDSKIDVAVTCQGSHQVFLFQGRSGGAVALGQIIPTISKPIKTALGDLDGDGIADLAVISGRIIGLHYGATDGSYSAPASLGDGLIAGYSDIVIHDLDADGLADIVAADRVSAAVRVFWGKGGHEFESAQDFDMGAAPSSLALADLDGNGLNDLTSASSGGGVLSVRLQQRGRGFGKPVSYPQALASLAHRIADLDLDGALDVAAFDAGSVMIFAGASAPAQPARFQRGDANGDGEVNVSDAITILNRLFLGGNPIGCDDAVDGNDDGRIDLSDPVSLLNHLFLGAGPLPAPGSKQCGPDPTTDGLGCQHGCSI